MSPGGRHLSPPSLLAHWNSGVPVLIPLEGDPRLFLLVDGPRNRLTLRAPISARQEIPRETLSHVRLASAVDDGRRYLEISTTDDRLLIDGYAMLSAIADRVQLEGIDPVQALEETLAKWHAILASRTRMSRQAEVGLFGELLVLEALVSSRGDAAIDSWRGSSAEEHDFGFLDADVEVKTTTGERRRHWVHGLDQLSATGSTPLWLLSVQITAGGLESGRTLGQLVGDVLGATREDAAIARLVKTLAANAWHEEEDDLFVESWRLRSRPLALRVDDAFPRLTSEGLTSCGVSIEGIGQVNYEIDVTGRRADETTATIDELLEEMWCRDA